jgi:hypothetical protein
MAIAIKIEVPWTETNTVHQLKLSLLDEDERPVMKPTQEGNEPYEVTASFEVGRPPGLRAGTPLDVSLAINIGPLSLEPGQRYTWRCYIKNETQDDWDTKDDWRVSFLMRFSAPPPRGTS